MTTAVCFQCGEIKFGAFAPCPACHALPTSEDERVRSLAMSDHYFDLDTLEEIADMVRQGNVPSMPSQVQEQLRELLRQGDTGEPPADSDCQGP